MERQPNFKSAFQMLGKCVICHDNEQKVCSTANDTERFVYDGKNEFRPHLEQGRVEECVIYQSTKK